VETSWLVGYFSIRIRYGNNHMVISVLNPNAKVAYQLRRLHNTTHSYNTCGDTQHSLASDTTHSYKVRYDTTCSQHNSFIQVKYDNTPSQHLQHDSHHSQSARVKTDFLGTHCFFVKNSDWDCRAGERKEKKRRGGEGRQTGGKQELRHSFTTRTTLLVDSKCDMTHAQHTQHDSFIASETWLIQQKRRVQAAQEQHDSFITSVTWLIYQKRRFQAAQDEYMGWLRSVGSIKW